VTSYFPDARFFNENGHLFPYDFRYDPDDRAHLCQLADGRIQFRVMAERGLDSGQLVLADGSAMPMDKAGPGVRFDIWQVTIDRPAKPFSYTFAFQKAASRPVYLVPAGVSNAVERLDRWRLDPGDLAPLVVPDWTRGAVIYQIFPERFHNGDPSLDPEGLDPWGAPPHWLRHQGGDLLGIVEKADYLADLGIDAVYLNPIFSSPSTHKYDTVDYYRVDDHLGGNEALERLVAKLHNRDIKLILDASFNHCHPSFFAFADVIANGPDSEYQAWFVVDEYPVRVRVRPHQLAAFNWSDPDAYLEHLRRLKAESGLALEEADDDGPPVETSYECWYGVPSMPRINLASPEARRYFLDVATHWITEYGIDGWRMDVARYVDSDFWVDFRKEVKAAHPDAYLLAEVMGDASPWLQGDRFDATMNYTFRELCIDYFATGRSSTEEFVDGYTRMQARYASQVNEVNQNLLSSHDTERLLHAAGDDAIKARLATAFQLLTPGAPGLYYGDEVGMTGGEEPASRGGFPWHDGDLWNRNLLETVTALTWMRRRYRALRVGDMQFVWRSPDAFAFTRTLGEERLLMIINRGAALGAIDIPVRSGKPQTLWGPGSGRPTLGSIVVTELGPLTATVIKL
jgi:glycosidase